MKRNLKTITIIGILLLTFSLLGCSNHETAKKAEKEVKTAKTVVNNDSKTVNPEQKKTEEKTTSVTTTAASPSAQSNNNTAQAPAKAATSISSKTSSSTIASSKPAATATKTTAATTTSTPAASKTSTPAKTQAPATTVTISVVGPKDRGTIIRATSVSISEGDTIYDVLLSAANSSKPKIIIDASGSGATTYIMGIDNIYASGRNGWVFKLNGESITKSTGVIKVKDGDRIECYYSE